MPQETRLQKLVRTLIECLRNTGSSTEIRYLASKICPHTTLNSPAFQKLVRSVSVAAHLSPCDACIGKLVKEILVIEGKGSKKLYTQIDCYYHLKQSSPAKALVACALVGLSVGGACFAYYTQQTVIQAAPQVVEKGQNDALLMGILGLTVMNTAGLAYLSYQVGSTKTKQEVAPPSKLPFMLHSGAYHPPMYGQQIFAYWQKMTSGRAGVDAKTS